MTSPQGYQFDPRVKVLLPFCTTHYPFNLICHMTMFKKENVDPWAHPAPPSPTPGAWPRLLSKNPIQYISYLICKNTKKFGIKIVEFDFVIEVNDIWPFDLF